jgi:hypothetical protein
MAFAALQLSYAKTSWSSRQAATRPEFRRVNTVLSNLKDAISGTYHAFKFAKYADHHLAEVQYRFNRRFDLKSILARLVRYCPYPPAARGNDQDG